MKSKKKKKLTVVDFFCGGGGFSEGFRQAGFEILLAVDYWQPAVTTHQENHPEGKTLKYDIIKLSKLPDEEFHQIVPDSEVIIGSPPCTAFSNSNKSGKGDKSKGIELFQAYLRIIARKKFRKNSKLKYWILENVPQVEIYLKEKYSLKELGLTPRRNLIVKGKNSGVYNAKYFGVPSNRIRYFCGDFPAPKEIVKEKNIIPLKRILDSLKSPDNVYGKIVDPIYSFGMKSTEVTDHHYIHELAEFEWRKAKRMKQDKGYMGKMSFPEDREKPSRTIMATLSSSVRESFILEFENSRYRVPTIREVASLMSFPIDYRFYAGSLGTKYKLVGNSVPPKMSYALATAILQKRRKPIKRKYQPIKHGQKEFFDLNFQEIPVKKEIPKKITSKYKYHIPYFLVNAFRVELTNKNSNFTNQKFVWEAEIHYSQGKRAEIFKPAIQDLSFAEDDFTKIKLFVDRLNAKSLPSFAELQINYCTIARERRQKNLIGPDEILEQIRDFIDVEFNFQPEPRKIPKKGEPRQIPQSILIGYCLLHYYLLNLNSSKNIHFKATKQVTAITGQLHTV